MKFIQTLYACSSYTKTQITHFKFIRMKRKKFKKKNYPDKTKHDFFFREYLNIDRCPRPTRRSGRTINSHVRRGTPDGSMEIYRAHNAVGSDPQGEPVCYSSRPRALEPPRARRRGRRVIDAADRQPVPSSGPTTICSY